MVVVVDVIVLRSIAYYGRTNELVGYEHYNKRIFLPCVYVFMN